MMYYNFITTEAYSALVISPHCDDAVIALGSYLYHSYKKVHIINVFNKSTASIIDLLESEVTKVRAKEDISISKQYGFTFENCGFADTSIRGILWNAIRYSVETQLLEEVVKCLLYRLSCISTSPKEVDIFIPCSYGLHPDHYLCLLACCKSELKMIISDFNNIFLYCEQPYYYHSKARAPFSYNIRSKRFVLHKCKFDENFKNKMLHNYSSQLSAERITLLTRNIQYEYFWQLNKLELLEKCLPQIE